MILVSLTEDDMKFIRELAQRRQDCKQQNGVKNQAVDQKTKWLDIEINGLKGELALARHLKISLNLDVHPGGDRGHDMTYQGVGIDVKYTRHKNGGLLFKYLTRFRCPMAVLTIHNTAMDIMLAGFISRARFTKIAITQDFGYGEILFVPQDKLTSMDEFQAAIDFLNGRNEDGSQRGGTKESGGSAGSDSSHHAPGGLNGY